MRKGGPEAVRGGDETQRRRIGVRVHTWIRWPQREVLGAATLQSIVWGWVLGGLCYFLAMHTSLSQLNWVWCGGYDWSRAGGCCCGYCTGGAPQQPATVDSLLPAGNSGSRILEGAAACTAVSSLQSCRRCRGRRRGISLHLASEGIAQGEHVAVVWVCSHHVPRSLDWCENARHHVALEVEH